jgi:hypothetical protein
MRSNSGPKLDGQHFLVCLKALVALNKSVSNRLDARSNEFLSAQHLVFCESVLGLFPEAAYPTSEPYGLRRIIAFLRD